MAQHEPAAPAAPVQAEKPKKKGKKLKICLLAGVVALAVLGAAGLSMLQPRAASPAQVSAAVLSEVGWTQQGAVGTMGQEQKVGPLTLKINVASVNYTKDIAGLLGRIRGLAGGSGLPISESQASALFLFRTDRVVLPSIADLQKDTVVSQLSGLAESTLTQTAQAAGISDLRSTGTQTVRLASGKEVPVKVYEATVSQQGVSITLKGVQAIWYDGGATVVSGIVPTSLKYGVINIPKSIFDGDAEFNSLRKMVSGVS